MNKAEFFTEVDKILGPQDPGKTLGYGRWRRGAGEGRYPGHGVIRWYSETCIHVMLYEPRIYYTYTQPEAAVIGLIFQTQKMHLLYNDPDHHCLIAL